MHRPTSNHAYKQGHVSIALIHSSLKYTSPILTGSLIKARFDGNSQAYRNNSQLSGSELVSDEVEIEDEALSKPMQ